MTTETMTPPAESSPAPAAPETMMLPTGAERDAFLKPGDMPKIPDAKPGESSTPENKSAEGQKPEEKGAPAPEAGKTKQERPNADKRKVELSTEIEDLLQRRHKMRTEIEEMETRLKTAPKSDSQPTKVEPPVQRDPREPVEPDQNDPKYKTWGEYETDLRKYNRDFAAFASTKAVEDFQAKQRLESQTNEMKGKVDAATARYGEEAREKIIAASSIFTDAKVPDVIKEMLNSSDVLPDLLYAIGGEEKNLTDFLDTARTNLPMAIRKLNAVESLVIAELAKGKTDRGPDGKFVAPEKKTTSAPAPPREVGGERAALPDELEEAFKEAEKTGDARKYIELENRKLLERRRGK